MGEQILLPSLSIIDKARKIANNTSFHISLYIIITAHMQHCYDLYHWLPLSLCVPSSLLLRCYSHTNCPLPQISALDLRSRNSVLTTFESRIVYLMRNGQFIMISIRNINEYIF